MVPLTHTWSPQIHLFQLHDDMNIFFLESQQFNQKWNFPNVSPKMNITGVLINYQGPAYWLNLGMDYKGETLYLFLLALVCYDCDSIYTS